MLVSLAAKIGRKYPFVSIPHFTNDLLNGMPTKQILQKYHLHYSTDYNQLVVQILKFKGYRTKNRGSDNIKANLQNSTWEKQYHFLMSGSEKFCTELEEMLNCNILAAITAHAVLIHEYIYQRDVEDILFQLCSNMRKDLCILKDARILASFESYIQNDFDVKMTRLIDYMSEQSYLISIDGSISVPVKYTTLPDTIYTMIDKADNGISYDGLRRKLFAEFPLLKMAVAIDVYESTLQVLEKDRRIVRMRSFAQASPSGNQLFTVKNYNSIMEAIRIKSFSEAKTKFFGRSIVPDQFIDELITLDIGDLDDPDDQVTRIAGLVISDGVLLQMPRDDLGEFDFVVDITNYHFSTKFEKMIKELGISTTATIFHCKVMTTKQVTESMVSTLQNSIPIGELGIVFTCMPVSENVRSQVKSDRIVQIMDENAIRKWCAITPVTPCRKMAVARIMYGDHAGMVVVVESLNYESGLATAVAISEPTELTVPIGSLREIPLNVLDPSQFEHVSRCYADFLSLLVQLAPDTFKAAFQTKIVTVKTQRGSTLWEIEFENVISTVALYEASSHAAFSCACHHRLDQEYYVTLCSHLVAAIDYVARNDVRSWSDSHHNSIILKDKLGQFKSKNIQSIIHALHYALNTPGQQILQAYLEACANLDS